MNARFNEVNSTVQMNLNKIEGLLLHFTVYLLETNDGFLQRMSLSIDQNLDQGSKFSSKINVSSEFPQNKRVRSPHRHKPNTTHLSSNGCRMREISQSVRIAKQVKNCADCIVRTVRMDDDVAEGIHSYNDMAYDDVAFLDW
jgi:hypothetical protein